MSVIERIKSHRTRHKLAYRLLLYVVMCSSFLTLLTTAVQLYTDYQNDLNAIQSNLHFIEESYVPGIETSLYEYNERQLRTQLEGVLKIQHVVYLEIDDLGSGDTKLITIGERDRENDIVQILPLSHKEQQGKMIPLGQLLIVISLKGVYQRLIDKFLLILLSNLIKTFLASLIILTIIQWLITRHLQTMAEYANNININVLNQPLILKRQQKQTSQPDELETVVHSINNMRIRLQEDILRREQAELALRESQYFFSQMFEQSATSTCFYNTEGTIIRVNPEFCKMFAMEAESITNWSYNIFRDQLVINSGVLPLLKDIFNKKKTRNWETVFDNEKAVRSPHNLASKRVVMFLGIFGYPILDSEGNLQYVVLKHYDITERILSEKALKESQHRLATHRELTPLGVIDFNTEFEITSWNTAAEKIFGYPRREAVGSNAYDIFLAEHEDIGKINSLLDPKSIENINESLTKDGRTVTCLWYNTPIYDIQGGLAGTTVVCQEITEKLKNEQEIKRLRNRLDNIFNSMPSILIGVDLQGNITDWNYKAVEVTGVPVNEAIGRSFIEVLPKYKNQLSRIKTAIQNKQAEFAKKIARSDGNAVAYDDVIIYPLIANGIEGAVIRIDDVTAQVEMEKMIVQTEKMISVGGLAAGMAHEINNPLGGMLQGVQNVQRRFLPDLESNLAPAREHGIDLSDLQLYMEKRGISSFLKGIQESGKKASQIISNMLQFSRKSESGLAPTNLVDLLENILELAGTDYDLKKKFDFRNIKIVKEFDADMPVVSCTKTEIEQVILNLLNNAAWAMANQEEGLKPQITLRLSVEKETARIEVQDNGPGMDEETRNRIFEPFFTTKPVGEGTGLGLSVSYMIITNNHGGSMEVESEPGKGTCFIIQLPLAREPLT